MTTYRDSRGATVQTGNRLGGGGEAEVFAVQGQSALVAKIYHKPTSDHDQKLALMIANPPVDPCQRMNPPHTSIAWPRERLYDSTGNFVGYTMPAVKGAVLLLKAFNPAERARTFATFPWRHLHQTAINLAQTVNAIHARGYVIGDLNESNIMLFPTTLITLIDTDSFQVQRYPCPVGKPEYTPPELQGKNLRIVQRAVEHDYFGLAVLIFQLLMEGNHPFRARWVGSGPPLNTLPEKIAQGLFPYSRTPSPQVQPPPGVYSFDMLHPAVSDLMRRCFEDGHRNPQHRPTPAEWEQALTTANNALVQCRRDKAHYYGKHQSTCPWCAAAARRAAAQPKAAAGATPALPIQTALPPLKLVGSAGTAAQPSGGGGTVTRRGQGSQPTAPTASSPLAQVRTTLVQFNWKLMLLWVLATVGSAIGAVFIVALLLFPTLPSEFVSFLHLDPLEDVGTFILGSFTGAIIGIGQWLVLRRHLGNVGWWVPATAVGGALGVGVSLGGVPFPGVLYSGAWALVFIMVIGTAQWLVLRRSVQQAGWWIAICATIGILGQITHQREVAIVFGYPLLTGVMLALPLRPHNPFAQARARLTTQPTAPVFWVSWLLVGAVGWGLSLAAVSVVGNVFGSVADSVGSYPWIDSFTPIQLDHTNTTVGLLQSLVGWIPDTAILPGPEVVIPVGISWALIGGLLGLTQWVGLRRHLQSAGWWVAASAIGLAVGLFAANTAMLQWGRELTNMLIRSEFPPTSYAPVFNAVRGAIIGLGLGGTQWLGLRKQYSGTAPWVLASVVGWAAAWGFSDTVEGMVLAGAISSAITGLVLIRLVSGLTPLGAKTRSALKWAIISACVVVVLNWLVHFP